MAGEQQHNKHLHVAMFPWFAMGHITPYMHLSNKLAEQGHQISFFLPSKTLPLVSSSNAHPDLITLIPVPLPRVPGLDPNVQTTADCDFATHHLLATAFDATSPFIESSLHKLKPDVVLYDFAYWLPQVAKRTGAIAVAFAVVCCAVIAHLVIPRRKQEDITVADVCHVPEDFPHPDMTLLTREARVSCMLSATTPFGEGMSVMDRITNGLMNSEAILFKTCREMDGRYLDYIEKVSKKVVMAAGPTLPVPPSTPLKEDLAVWLGKFKPKSVVYCAFGSEWVLCLDQFQELLLGIELTGLPFLIALKPPVEAESLEAAMPEGFKQRTEERGVVTGEWVQQQQILAHESVGCFVTHCGSGSITEGLISECQLVLAPQAGDQPINARVMSQDLRVGVEIEKEDEDGLFDRHGVCRAIERVMNTENGIGKEVKINHEKWRRVLLSPGLEKTYLDEFVMKLKQLISSQ